MHTQKIAFLNEGFSFFLPSPLQTQDWLIKVIEHEGATLGELTFIFCSDDYLHKINLERLNHDTLTDVISFQYSEEITEGDIFISVERTNENASHYKVDPLLELYRVMVHGLLHLLGYKDKSPDDKIKMTKKEDFYLDLLNQISSSN
jgi:probable rRNA maturation factor